MSHSYSVLAGGDVMPGGALGEWILSAGVERKRAELAALLGGADFVTANLECAITARTERRRGQLWNLRADPALAPLLAPFHALALANNHILDFGAEGLADTLDALTRQHIQYCGAGTNLQEALCPAIHRCGDFTFGALAFTDPNWYPATATSPGCAVWDPERATGAIAALAQQVDFVVVHLHQGYEFLDYPGPEEMTAARQAVEAGADLVLCHHSHTVMGIKRYGKAAVAYGLGNLLFDQIHGAHGAAVNRRMLVRFDVGRHEVLDWQVMPLVSDEHGWPVAAEGMAAQAVLTHVANASSALADEAETARRFREQASAVMLPHALRSLAQLLRQEGPAAVIQRLRRLRRVDFSVMLTKIVRPAAGSKAAK